MMNRLIFGLLASTIAVSASAETWTLDQCIQYAVEHNLTVRAREIDYQGAELSVTEARSGFLPSVAASASQGWNFGRGLTSENTYANRNTSSFSWDLGAQVPLFQGLANVRKTKYARTNLKAALYKLESAKDDITLNIIAQYLQVLYCDEVLQTAVQQVNLSQATLERQQALADAGRIAEIQVLEATSQLAQDQLSVTDARNDYTLAMVDLAQLMQLPDIQEMAVSPLGEEETLIPSANEVYAYAADHNSKVLADQADIDAANDQIKVAETGYIPKLSFNAGLSLSYYTVNGMSNPSFSSQMKDNFNKYVGFSLSVPIFDGLSTSNSVKRARIDRINAQLALETTRSDLHKAIQQAYYQAIGARSKYETSLTTEDALRRTFEAMSEKYDLGRANSTEYEQAKTDYFKAQLQRIQARYELILRQRILAFYSH